MARPMERAKRSIPLISVRTSTLTATTHSFGRRHPRVKTMGVSVRAPGAEPGGDSLGPVSDWRRNCVGRGR